MNPFEGLGWQELELALTENYAEQADTHARIARETEHLDTIARNRGFILDAMGLHTEPVELRVAD